MLRIMPRAGSETAPPTQHITSVAPFRSYEPGSLFLVLLFVTLVKIVLCGVAVATLVVIACVRHSPRIMNQGLRSSREIERCRLISVSFGINVSGDLAGFDQSKLVR